MSDPRSLVSSSMEDRLNETSMKPMNRREFGKLAALSGITLGLAACGTSKASTSSTVRSLTPVTMADASGPNVAWIANYVALEAGYFADEGLDVTYDYAPAVTQTIAGVTSGSYLLGFTGTQAALAAAQSGAPVRIVAVEGDQFGAQIAASSSFLQSGPKLTAPLKTRVLAMKGAKIGVEALGDSGSLLVTYLLKQFGLNPTSEVTLVPLGTVANEVAALGHGEVDLFVGATGGAQQAEQEGVGKVYISPNQDPTLAGYIFLVGSANTATLASRSQRELVISALKAIERGKSLIKTNPTEARRLAERRLPDLSPSVFNTSFDLQASQFPATIVPTRAEFDAYTKVLQFTGKPTPSFSQVIDAAPATTAISG